MKLVLAVGTACLTACCLFYLAFLNYIEPAHVGVAWNFAEGEVSLMQPGWHFSPPWVEVSRIDTRPMRVCITTAGRGYNCRLVQFVPSAYKQFVAVEGFRYYWWANRISFNSGYSQEYRGMRDLIRGYAYSIKQYPFVVTLREFREDK